MILILLLVLFIIARLELPSIYNMRQYKELSVYIVLYSIGIGLSFYKIFVGIPPSPLVLVEKVYQPFSKMLVEIFHI